uniref:Uncharacterized protein n=2 Tax=Oryza barthii TaxID=65489 RepID=A0A0D3H3V4_9ORYZ
MEREVRVTLRGDRLGQVPRCEARPEPRDPRRELLVRRRADGGLGLHHVRGHSCFFSSRYAIGAEATEAAREAAGGGGEECHGGRARLLRPRRFWIVLLYLNTLGNSLDVDNDARAVWLQMLPAAISLVNYLNDLCFQMYQTPPPTLKIIKKKI